MAKQSEVTPGNPNKSSGNLPEPAPQVEPLPELEENAELANSMFTAPTASSRPDPESKFSRRRWQTIQRQELAMQIGSVQGNRHFQRVVASLKTSDKPEPALLLEGSDTSAGYVQRFDSDEHQKLGAKATGGEVLDIDLGEGIKLEYGEMVALAGDYFGSVKEITDLAKTPAGQAELRWARWSALHIGAEPNVAESVKKNARDRYYRLAAVNFTHFSAGGTAHSAYAASHEEALGLAFFAGASADPAKWAQARITEAFGNHYLTDMFSAGHVRTPRTEIKQWYQQKYPGSVDTFVSYAAQFVTERLDRMGDIPWYWPNASVQDKIVTKIRDLGGPAVESFSLGDVVGLAFHNQDNKQLKVVSDLDPDGKEVPGGYHWIGKGDGNLKTEEITGRMALAGLQASLKDLDLLYKAGQQASGGRLVPENQLKPALQSAIANIKPYAAERFVPREDTPADNTQMNWKWGEIDPVLRAAIDATVKGTIASTLRDKSSSIDEVERLNRWGDKAADGAIQLHVRAAFLPFCEHLATGGITALEQAMASSPRTPSDAEMDAGSLPGGVPEDSLDAGVPVPTP